MLLLKNSFSRNCRKRNCFRMRYKRSSRIPRHFVSPNFGSFVGKREFFNSHRCLHSNSDSLRFSSHRLLPIPKSGWFSHSKYRFQSGKKLLFDFPIDQVPRSRPTTQNRPPSLLSKGPLLPFCRRWLERFLLGLQWSWLIDPRRHTPPGYSLEPP
jgi:hypothetical protein